MTLSDSFARVSSKWNTVLLQASLKTGLNLGTPSYVCAKMTMRCNSRCAHCNIWKMDFEEKELTTDQWLRVLDELANWLGRFRMDFTGGEALLRSDMPAILEHAVKLGISVELLSNGLAIGDEMARRIAATGIDQITMSMDGFTPEVHDRFRGAPGYHAATRGAILRLSECRTTAPRPFRILLKTVISAHSLGELAALARWAREHQLEIKYQPIEQNYGEQPDPAWYRTSPLWIVDLDALRGELDALRRLKADGCPIVNQDGDFDRFYRYFAQPETMMARIQAHNSSDEQGACGGIGNFVISSNGDVRMCFGMEPFGNVTQKSPRELWRDRKRCWAAPCDHR
jgi:MoaA/NifB/PqqE/SkfB family radical SAM enzyme